MDARVGCADVTHRDRVGSKHRVDDVSLDAEKSTVTYLTFAIGHRVDRINDGPERRRIAELQTKRTRL